MYSPVAHREATLVTTDQFTAEEHARFIRRYENGYDLHDSRYSLWKELHHTSLNHLHTTTGNSSPYGMLNRSLSSDHVQDIG